MFHCCPPGPWEKRLSASALQGYKGTPVYGCSCSLSLSQRMWLVVFLFVIGLFSNKHQQWTVHYCKQWYGSALQKQVPEVSFINSWRRFDHLKGGREQGVGVLAGKCRPDGSKPIRASTDVSGGCYIGQQPCNTIKWEGGKWGMWLSHQIYRYFMIVCLHKNTLKGRSIHSGPQWVINPAECVGFTDILRYRGLLKARQTTHTHTPRVKH